MNVGSSFTIPLILRPKRNPPAPKAAGLAAVPRLPPLRALRPDRASYRVCRTVAFAPKSSRMRPGASGRSITQADRKVKPSHRREELGYRSHILCIYTVTNGSPYTTKGPPLDTHSRSRYIYIYIYICRREGCVPNIQFPSSQRTLASDFGSSALPLGPKSRALLCLSLTDRIQKIWSA